MEVFVHMVCKGIHGVCKKYFWSSKRRFEVAIFSFLKVGKSRFWRIWGKTWYNWKASKIEANTPCTLRTDPVYDHRRCVAITIREEYSYILQLPSSSSPMHGHNNKGFMQTSSEASGLVRKGLNCPAVPCIANSINIIMISMINIIMIIIISIQAHASKEASGQNGVRLSSCSGLSRLTHKYAIVILLVIIITVVREQNKIASQCSVMFFHAWGYS